MSSSSAASAPSDGDDSTSASSFQPVPGTKYYKIRLSSGRVLGPFDLERIRVFIQKNKINGNEVARLYPSGTWKDINQFPEIAEIILQHIEGRLGQQPQPQPVEENEKPADPTPEKPVDTKPAATVPPLEEDSAAPVVKASNRTKTNINPSRDEEGTMVITRDTEGTMVIEKPDDLNEPDTSQLPEPEPESLPDAEPNEEEMGLVELSDIENKIASGQSVSAQAVRKAQMTEKTVVLALPPKNGSGSAGGVKRLLSPRTLSILTILFVAFAAMELLAPTEQKKPAQEQEETIAFKVEFPSIDRAKIDAQQSELTFKSAIPLYNLDTVDGYKKAAMIFGKAVSQNPSNISAIALMASCYINLVDVLNRDEKFFQVVTGLIEGARAKQVDIPEFVIVEVEFLNLLANPDGAINRLVEYSKLKLQQQKALPVEMFYYIATSYYQKGSYSEAVKYLDQIPQEQWFSVKIPYLYGLIFEANNQLDQAMAAYEKVIQKSPKHLKARTHLAEVLLRKDNMAGAGTQADFVIANRKLASEVELARSYYIRGKLRGSVKRNEEALSDLEAAKRLEPNNTDILLEYYTVKARVAGTGADAAKKAKIYQLLAKGEAAIKENQLSVALKAFMDARKEDERMAQPLLRMAEVYRRQGDVYAAMQALEKAVKIDPTKAEHYPSYVKAAIESYEYKAAHEAIKKFETANPSPDASTIDFLNGYLNLRQDRLREAGAYLKRALKTAAPDVNLYLLYAETLFKTENYRDAAFFYGLARRFDPLNLEAITGMAKSLAERDGVDAGVKYVEEEMKRTNNKAPFRVALAEVYLRKGDLTQALKMAEVAINDDPKGARAYKIKGDALQQQEQYKEALNAYSAYLSLNPSDPAPRIERYKIALRQMDFVTAKSEINRVLLAYPRYQGAHFYLGDLALQAQNPKDALFEADLELKNNPEFAPALVLAGNALNMGGEFVRALELFNKVLAANPYDVLALIGAGFAQHRLKAYPAAQTLLERALKIDTGNPMIRKRLGSLYHDMGDQKAANLHFKAYLELYPNAPDKAEIERYLH